MKKVLLGTSMLVGTALLAGGAMAQTPAPNPVVSPSPFTVTLQAYSTFAFQTVNETSGPNAGTATVSPKQQTYRLSSNQRFSISADARADNGLQYGFFMRFDFASGSTNTIGNNRSWTYFQGGFGRLELADRNDFVGDTIGFTTNSALNFGPTTGDTFGPNGGFAQSNILNKQGINNSIDGLAAGYTQLSNSKSRQIKYVTPTFAGFKAVLGYAPQTTALYRNPNRNAQVVSGDVTLPGAKTDADNHLNLSGTRDHVGIAIDYTNTFGPVGVEIGVGGEYAKAKGAAATAVAGSTNSQYNNAKGVVADVRLAYAGFGLQANYANQFDSLYAKRNPAPNPATAAGYYNAPDAQGGSVGLNYTFGPYTVGTSYGAASTGGDPTLPGSNSYQIISVGGHYILARGLMLFAGADFIRFKGEAGFTGVPASRVPNQSPTVVTIGTHLKF